MKLRRIRHAPSPRTAEPENGEPENPGLCLGSVHAYAE